jgi:hypothetical protein
MIIDAEKDHFILVKNLIFLNVEALPHFWIKRIQIKIL